MSQPKIFGLIGNPISHSLSPLMHNAAFKHLKINAEYKLFPLEEKEVQGFMQKLKDNHISGINVTVPYKEKVIPFLDSISDEAKLIGAANTIEILKGELIGHNTDGMGFIRHLSDDLKFIPAGKNISIIGAGGASRAIAVYLSMNFPKSITIYDIDKHKLNILTGYLQSYFPAGKIIAAESVEALQVKEADLLVNATPVGMKETDPLLIEPNDLHKDLLVCDLLYKPQETKLLKAAKENGAKVSNGLGMLLYQGMIAFEIWTGKTAPKEVMYDTLLRSINV